MPDVWTELLTKLEAKCETAGKSINQWLSEEYWETQDVPVKTWAANLLALTKFTATGISEVVANTGYSKENCFQVVELLEGYKRLSQRTISQLLEKSQSGSPALKNLADKAEANLAKLYDLLDQIESYIPAIDFDECQQLFLQSLLLSHSDQMYTTTAELFRNEQTSVKNLDALINAWSDGISNFIEDAQQTDSSPTVPAVGLADTVKFGEAATIVDFLCMHDCLETLYSRLVTNVPNE